MNFFSRISIKITFHFQQQLNNNISIYLLDNKLRVILTLYLVMRLSLNIILIMSEIKLFMIIDCLCLFEVKTIK